MNTLTVYTQKKRFDIAPNLYGLFFEDINRAADGGLYPEMLRNRAFEDSLPPERCTVSDGGATFITPNGWKDAFNHGEGLSRWMNEDETLETPAPAWHAQDAEMTLDWIDRLNSKRLVSLRVAFNPGSTIYNTGFAGIPVVAGQSYSFFMFAKSLDKPAKIEVRIESANGDRQYAATEFCINAHGYSRYDTVFTASETDFHARLVISAPNDTAYLNIGFTSLMPADTYNGHGLRSDLVEKLKDLHAKFLRFPGGCIVEGFTCETAMRFSNTIGPVWERPSQSLMWHYRSTNGLGHHEYLQLCEDLDLEPLYVLNCGLTCQARSPEFFEGAVLEDMLDEAIAAIEYAVAPADSKWGKIRSAAGHPEPFKMNYVEIGNENFGREYNIRYKKFYDELKKRFPFITYISNTHTEQDGLPTEVVDEHYYNVPEFFAENISMYDTYNREGPKIFVGEYAVTQGTTANLHCALHEGMFLTGLERNQDVVTLSSYAPLFENSHYAAWYPNLIVFDNHRSYGIPTYYVLSMFARNRGSEVVESFIEAGSRYRPVLGIHGIGSGKPGLQFKNPSFNGQRLDVSHSIRGRADEKNGIYTTIAEPLADWMRSFAKYELLTDMTLLGLGDEPVVEGEFKVEIKASKDTQITLGTWLTCPDDSLYMQDRLNITGESLADWPVVGVRQYAWRIANGLSSLVHGGVLRSSPLTMEVPISINHDAFNAFKIITRANGFDCYINNELVHTFTLPTYPEVGCVVTTDNETVYIKLVNVVNMAQEINIQLDCNVAPEYEVELLSGDPMAQNTLDNPECVAMQRKNVSGAANNFIYRAPASSISVLRLRRV